MQIDFDIQKFLKLTDFRVLFAHCAIFGFVQQCNNVHIFLPFQWIGTWKSTL